MKYKLVIVMVLLITSFVSADILSSIAGDAAQKAMAEAQDETIDRILDDVQSLHKDDSIRVIIMPIEGDWMGHFTDCLLEKATQRTRIKLIDREHLQDLVREQQKGQLGLVDQESAVKVGKLLGANVLVYGKILKKTVNPNSRKACFEVSGRVVEVETARILIVKSYEAERKIDGEFSWEKLNEWTRNKGGELGISW